MLFTRLVQDISAYGLIFSEGVIPFNKIERKLAAIPQLEFVHEKSLFYSFESIATYYPPDKTLSVDVDGCVGSSPSATAGAILNALCDKNSLDYIADLLLHQGDGGLPTVDFADTFEITWVLDNLRYAGLIHPNDENVKPILNYLWSTWIKRGGNISFSSRFQMPDLDETSVAYTLLHWAGYPADDSIFTLFEGDDYFYCYPNELDPSLSANIRFLVALQYMNHPMKARWEDKVIGAIRSWTKDAYWYDKWHISPYYLTASAIWMLEGILGDVLPEKIQWIVDTQNQDGGWGFYGRSTAEETAYCIQALSVWSRHFRYETALRRGNDFLEQSANSPLPAMWVGKCLYTPRKVVESSILSAKFSFHRTVS